MSKTVSSTLFNSIILVGVGLVAAHFSDDIERGKKMAFYISGCGLGIIMGPPVGGIAYQYLGKELPFFLLACFALFELALQVKESVCFKITLHYIN